MHHCCLPPDYISTAINPHLQPLSQSNCRMSQRANWCPQAGAVQNIQSTTKHTNSRRRQNSETVLIYWDTLTQPAENAEIHDKHTPIPPFDKRDNNFNAWLRQYTADKLADAPHELDVHRIVHHVDEGHNLTYVLCWYGYTSIDGTVNPGGNTRSYDHSQF